MRRLLPGVSHSGVSRGARACRSWRLVIVTHALLDEPQVSILDRMPVVGGATQYVYRCMYVV